jgi:hypothetical protein
MLKLSIFIMVNNIFRAQFNWEHHLLVINKASIRQITGLEAVSLNYRYFFGITTAVCGHCHIWLYHNHSILT